MSTEKRDRIDEILEAMDQEAARRQPMPDEVVMFTIDEVAVWLGYTDQWIRRAIDDGRLRAVRLFPGPKATWRISLADLKEFVRNGRDNR